MMEKRGRILFVLLMLGAGFAAVGLRLVHLQVVERGDLTRRAERQQERLVKLEPKRGTIVDRQGRELAVSLDVESVYGVPTEVGNPRQIARELARILQENPVELEKRLASDRRFVWLSRKVDRRRPSACEASTRVPSASKRSPAGSIPKRPWQAPCSDSRTWTTRALRASSSGTTPCCGAWTA